MGGGRWDAARRRSQAVAAAWRQSPEHRMLAATFDADAAADLPLARRRAEALLADIGWAEALLAPLIEALRDEPLLDPPLRVNRDGARIGAVLFEAPAVRVGVTVLSAAAIGSAPRPRQVVLSGRVAVIRHVRAGDVVAERWCAPPVGAAAPQVARGAGVLRPRDGEVSTLDGRTEGQLTLSASGDLVTITALLNAGAAPMMRAFSTGDGRLLRSASTDDGASRAAMLLTLLRVAGRSDATATFDAASRDHAFHLRWHAMRDWLATDAPAAWPRLADMAEGDPHPQVRAAARVTMARIAPRQAA